MSSAVSVYLDNTGAVTANVETQIPLDAVDYDLLDEFDEVTDYDFTATEAGKYLVSGQVAYGASSDGDSLYAILKLNDTSFVTGVIEPGGGGFHTVHAAKVIDVSIGDLITLYGINTDNNDVIVSGIAATFMTITRLL